MKLCECGCGRPTLPYKVTDKRIGAVKGEPAQRIKGHNRSRWVRSRNGSDSCSL